MARQTLRNLFAIPVLFFPKALDKQMFLAGLLTCSTFNAFPFLVLEQWPEMLKAVDGTYSSGNCFGFAPNSLLILFTRMVTKNHKLAVKVIKKSG